MSPERRLNAGLYGKHPAFGDFIGAGLPDEVVAPLANWIQASLGEWRDRTGEGWGPVFDGMPRLGFWIGPALMGGEALRGAMAPSRDRSGRRFPMIVAQSGGVAPVTQPQPDFDHIAGLALASILDSERPDPRGTAERLARELPSVADDQDQPTWPTFWARNDAIDATALFDQLREADHAHATAARSYWWFSDQTDQGGSGILACQGWPGPDDMAWLIEAGEPAAVEPQSEDIR